MSPLILETEYLTWEKAWDVLQGQTPGETKLGFKVGTPCRARGAGRALPASLGCPFPSNLNKSSLVTEYTVQDGSVRNALG